MVVSNANLDVLLSIRQFVLSEVNIDSNSYYELANLNAKDIEEVPALKGVKDSMLEGICCNPFYFTLYSA